MQLAWQYKVLQPFLCMHVKSYWTPLVQKVLASSVLHHRCFHRVSSLVACTAGQTSIDRMHVAGVHDSLVGLCQFQHFRSDSMEHNAGTIRTFFSLVAQDLWPAAVTMRLFSTLCSLGIYLKFTSNETCWGGLWWVCFIPDNVILYVGGPCNVPKALPKNVFSTAKK